MYATPVSPSATTSNVRASLLHVLQVVLCMLPGDISACVMSYIVHRLLCVAPSRGQSPLGALLSWPGRSLPQRPLVSGPLGIRCGGGIRSSVLVGWRLVRLRPSLRLFVPAARTALSGRLTPNVNWSGPHAFR